ncbi:MAG: ABC transporter ATP-binding protein [Chloroflexota bacterium]
MAELAAENVGKVFVTESDGHLPTEVVALSDFNLTVKDGTFVSLLGPSGCGKSTFLWIACGMEPLSTGSVVISGRPVGGPRPDVSVVFQDPLLLPWQTVLQNVAFGLKARGIGRLERERAARDYIERSGLKGFESSYPHQLSGGMRQRVGIARAWVVNPGLLLMDEPFVALDEQTRTLFQEALLHIYDRNRTTVVFVTHNINEGVFLSDEVAVMTSRPGRVKKVIRVPFPRPRTLGILDDPLFHEVRTEAWELIRDDARRVYENQNGLPDRLS